MKLAWPAVSRHSVAQQSEKMARGEAAPLRINIQKYWDGGVVWCGVLWSRVVWSVVLFLLLSSLVTAVVAMI